MLPKFLFNNSRKLKDDEEKVPALGDKLCPFCGSEPEMTWYADRCSRRPTEEMRFHFGCSSEYENCSIRPSAFSKTNGGARDEWNRRVK